MMPTCSLSACPAARRAVPIIGSIVPDRWKAVGWSWLRVPSVHPKMDMHVCVPMFS